MCLRPGFSFSFNMAVEGERERERVKKRGSSVNILRKVTEQSQVSIFLKGGGTEALKDRKISNERKDG